MPGNLNEIKQMLGYNSLTVCPITGIETNVLGYADDKTYKISLADLQYLDFIRGMYPIPDMLLECVDTEYECGMLGGNVRVLEDGNITITVCSGYADEIVVCYCDDDHDPLPNYSGTNLRCILDDIVKYVGC